MMAVSNVVPFECDQESERETGAMGETWGEGLFAVRIL